MKRTIVMLNLFQHPFRRRAELVGKWALKRVQGDGLRFAVVAGALMLTACAATQQDAVAPAAPGFWLGLWHGFIFPVAWIVSLFTDKVAIYAVPNNGGWYDFGYFLGIVVFGVGAKRGHKEVRDRTIDVRAKRID